MQINNLEKFIAAASGGKCAAGMVVTFNDAAVSELAGDAGFDFTWIDMEHSPLTIDNVSGQPVIKPGFLNWNLMAFDLLKNIRENIIPTDF